MLRHVECTVECGSGSGDNITVILSELPGCKFCAYQETEQNITLVRYRCAVLIKIEPDATVCRYLFTAKSLYMFRVSQHPSSGVLKTVTAASDTGHNTGTATSL